MDVSTALDLGVAVLRLLLNVVSGLAPLVALS